MKIAPIPAWLDEETSALVEDTVRMLIKRHANILLAVILFGSAEIIHAFVLVSLEHLFLCLDVSLR